MDWKELCETCPHHAQLKCESLGQVCEEVLEAADMPAYDWSVNKHGRLVNDRVSKPPAAVDHDLRTPGKDFLLGLSTARDDPRRAELYPDRRLLEVCPLGCAEGTDPKDLMGLRPDGTGQFVPTRQWTCSRCGCRVRAWMLPTGHYAVHHCPLCVGWKTQFWGPPEREPYGWDFSRLRSIPPMKIRFRSKEDLEVAIAAVDRLRAVWIASTRKDELYQIAMWSLVGFVDESGLKEPTAAELSARLPRLGKHSRTMSRYLQLLEPHLTAARNALNQGSVAKPNDPDYV